MSTGAGDSDHRGGDGQRPVNAMCVTPFDSDDRLDEAALATLVGFLADAGVGIYLGSYGSGEGHLLRPAEVRRLYEVGVKAADGRAPVYAAALGFTATDHVIELAHEALAIGVDAVQVHPPRPGPTAIRPRRQELERYYADVLGAIEGPVHLTNQRVMVGYGLPDDLVVDLVADHPQVLAVNTSDMDLRAVLRLIDAVSPLPVYVGVVSQLVAALAAGGAGALCFEADLAPALCLAVCEAWRASDLERLHTSFRSLMRLNEVLSRYQNPRSVKAAMRLVGLPAGGLRRPYLPLDDHECRDIERVLAELGLVDAGGGA